ncbi:hypothetical protein [Heyndrickxia oleronia]|uniref:hypothetical protein n=1 Tax=Heyndrickxia oleronia TaxID=38875 RepID=UPI0021B335EE|nr:hypothetical protein [Heyndrickxia oleronia]
MLVKPIPLPQHLRKEPYKKSVFVVALVKALLPAFTSINRLAFFYCLQLFSQWNERMICGFHPIFVSESITFATMFEKRA